MDKNANDISVNANIIVSEYMNIVKADESLFMFLGEISNFIFTRVIYPSDLAKFETAIKEADEGQQIYVSIRLRGRDGVYKWMHIMISPYPDRQSGKYYSLEITDISTLKQQNDEIRAVMEMQTEFLSIIGDYLFTYDISRDSFRIILPGNGNQNIVLYEGKLGVWTTEKLDNGLVDSQSIQDFEGLCMAMASGESYFSRDIKMKIADYDNVMYWYTFKGKRILKNDDGIIIAGAVCITHGKEDKAADISVQDELRDAGTDLLNKKAITNYARKLIDKRVGHKVTIAIIDIDDFKSVNDTYGHMFGDEVLRDVAGILKKTVGRNGLCGRIGGDEMFIVMEHLEDDESIRTVFRTIKNNVSWLYHNDPRNINKITCSIGAASYPDDAKDLDTLFSIADKMLYLAKEKGKNRYIIYRPDLHERYILGENPTATTEKVFYKYRKLRIVNDFIQQYICHYKSKKECLEMVMSAFEMDSIFLYDMYAGTRYVLSGNVPEYEENGEFLKEDNYIPDFRDDGIKTVWNIILYERKAPHMYEAFEKMGIKQFIQVIACVDRSKSDSCFVISFNRNSQLNKWPEMDVDYLGIIGNVIGEEYMKEKKNNDR
ncbi:two-component system PleD related family response regulator [Eubacterium sp. CAG:252]|nr:two-component system PleD related family response regulator [Eubacterium sp. CAG:252]